MPEEDKNNENLPEELQKILLELVKKYEEEDSWVRKQQVKLWKKNDEFWHGIQFIFWSESRQDWISPVETRWFETEEGREEAQGPFYDFVINIYRAHGESIIAALSAEIPSVRFPPDDAEDEDDIQTAKTFSKISDLIDRHNQVKQLLLQALLMLWNFGSVFAYHAPKADKNFGKIMVPNYKKSLSCETCGITKPADETDDIEGMPCPTCGQPMQSTIAIDSFDESPKSRVLIDIFGPLHVKVPYYARNQKECGYLIFSLDQPLAFLKNLYPHVADKIERENNNLDSYERLARTPSSFSSMNREEDNRNLFPLKRVWLRPWVFDGLRKDQEEARKKLQKLFPNGVYCCFVGNTYVESRDEDADKYWTIGKAGLSQYIHADALGQPLISPQEMRNVLVNLTLETIEQGIPTQYADTEVLNFEVYSKHEARPGMTMPIKRKPGERAGDAFYEGSRASLSKEVPGFGNQLDKDAQFVVGSFPSIYGGPGEGKSRTAAEYNMSRQMALQRLSITWSLFVLWFAKMKEKCVHLYVENLVQDERFVQMENDNYVNVWIRKSELDGHVGEVEPEGAETFPVSTAQKQQLLLKLIEFNNEFLNAAIFDSQNRNEIADVLSFPELHIPGEDQRLKQMREIKDMMKGEQVQVEPEVDDNQIHAETCKFFLCDTVGMDLKRTNPQAYAMIVQHLTQHMQILTQQTMQAHGATAPGEAPGGVQ